MDPIRAGMLKAAAEDYLRECEKIDHGIDETQRVGLQEAYAALSRGDTAKRDRICARLLRLPEAAQAAKLEIGLRIGERIGFSREALLEAVARHRRTN